MITVEMAADIVKNLPPSSHVKVDAFTFFEKYLNPHQPKKDGHWSLEFVKWQAMFAEMCGFIIATEVISVR